MDDGEYDPREVDPSILSGTAHVNGAGGVVDQREDQKDRLRHYDQQNHDHHQRLVERHGDVQDERIKHERKHGLEHGHDQDLHVTDHNLDLESSREHHHEDDELEHEELDHAHANYDHADSTTGGGPSISTPTSSNKGNKQGVGLKRKKKDKEDEIIVDPEAGIVSVRLVSIAGFGGRNIAAESRHSALTEVV